MLPTTYQGPDLAPDLYGQFVAFIDRSEKTARTYKTNLRQFATFLTRSGITRPTRQDIILYRQYLTADHAPATVKAYLQSVKQFFKWTAAEGIYPNIAENIHAPKIRTNEHKKEALTPADVLTIENSIKHAAEIRQAEAAASVKDTAGRRRRATEQSKRLLAMYLLSVNAGLRTIEIQRASIKDLQIIRNTPFIYIWGKGHTEPDTRKALAWPVYEALQDYIKSRSDRPAANSPLFVATGNRSGGKRLATTTISTMLKRAMQSAGYDSDRITAHSLRHTAGTNVQRITQNIYLTQKYMRHANPATTEIYLHVDTEKQEATTAQQLYNIYHRPQEAQK